MCYRCDTTDRILHPERYEDENPWIPSDGDASEPHTDAGDATSSSETRPSLITDEVYWWGS